MSLQSRPLPRQLAPPPLSTMFEEDFERCFICQQPCKGLYCSSECRIRDKGVSEAPTKTVPMQLTAQLPPALSPLVRPHHNIHLSPRLPPHFSHNDSSSSSSITSSPLQSPATNPAGAESPEKEPFDLPPPAFPSQSPFPGSVPVKIPNLASARQSPLLPQPHAQPSSSGQATPYHGTSIDTLRFGRKPSLINSVTSPNALVARCACGKPANHRSRPTSTERHYQPLDSDFSRLSLGPSVLAPKQGERYGQGQQRPEREKHRFVSDSIMQPIDRRAASSGYTTPHGDTSPGSFGASLLSRSRSDPIPPALRPRNAENSAATPNRRASEVAHQGMGRVQAMSRTTSSGAGSGTNEGSRGRSRERVKHAVEPAASLLNHPPEREAAPSRSRHRRDERERRDDRERGSRSGSGFARDPTVTSPKIAAAAGHGTHSPSLHAHKSLPPLEAAPIMPSLINRVGVINEGIAPSLRRKDSPEKV